MKIVKLNLKESAISSDIQIDVFKNQLLCSSLVILENLRKVMYDLQEYYDSENSEESSDTEFKLLAQSEEIMGINLDDLIKFDRAMLGTASIERRVTTILSEFGKTKELVDKNSSVFLPYSKEEADLLIHSLANVVGNLAAFILFQFDFYNLAMADSENEIDEINDSIEYLMKLSNRSLKELIDLSKDLRTLMINCSPVMDYFEKYPERMAEFSSIVGESIMDCEGITINQIQDLVNGTKSFDEIFEELN